MSTSPIRSATETPSSSNWPQAPQTARLELLRGAIASCELFSAAAEHALLTGGFAAARLSFTRAEAAFEEAQHYAVDMAADAMSVDVEQKSLSNLGLRLDAVWMRLVCTNM